jgi:hypothetical protein
MSSAIVPHTVTALLGILIDDREERFNTTASGNRADFCYY